MKVTIKDLLDSAPALGEIGKLPLPPQLALKIGRVMRQCVTLADTLGQEVFIITNSQHDDLTKATMLEEFANKEIEIEGNPIPVHSLKVDVQPRHLMALHWLFV